MLLFLLYLSSFFKTFWLFCHDSLKCKHIVSTLWWLWCQQVIKTFQLHYNLTTTVVYAICCWPKRYMAHDSISSFFKKIYLIYDFLKQFRFTSTLSRKYRVSIYFCHPKASATNNIIHQCGALFTLGKSALTYHHPESIVYIRVLSVFYILWILKICNDILLLL